MQKAWRGTEPGTRAGAHESDLLSQAEPGPVDVEVNNESKVVAVILADQWRREVQPRNLGSALCATTNRRIRQQLVRSMKNDAEANRSEALDASACPIVGRSSLGDARLRELSNELTHSIEEYYRELTSYVEAVRREKRNPRVAAGDLGLVRVTARDGQILRVWLDIDWAVVASNREIGVEAASALGRVQSSTVTMRSLRAAHLPSLVRIEHLGTEMLRGFGLVDQRAALLSSPLWMESDAKQE